MPTKTIDPPVNITRRALFRRIIHRDLSDLDLTNLDFHGLNLTEHDFQGITLTGAVFLGAVGLTPEVRAYLKSYGAIVDEPPATHTAALVDTIGDSEWDD